MSDPIRVGDLVYVARWSHEHLGDISLGRMGVVDSIEGRCICRICNYEFVEPVGWSPGRFAVPLRWLKKIPPLSELEGKRDAHDIPVELVQGEPGWRAPFYSPKEKV